MFFWKKNNDAVLYVHFPCFDGVVSAVLALLFLEQQGWKFRSIEPVNYAMRNQWPQRHLPARSAVVDFLYHPQAVFWADHHQTTFLNPQLRADFESRKNDAEWRIYDASNASCASLLWERLHKFFSPNARIEEMVEWAAKIDSARYDSVKEALFGDHPALVIAASLAVEADGKYCRFLIHKLRAETLAAVAGTREVQRRFKRARALLDIGMQRVRAAIRVEGGVASFETPENGALIPRYAPYYYYPEARYSVALVTSEDAVRITAMRNPWIEFESVNLGAFMQRFGGGGHARVGALVLPPERRKEAEIAVEQLLVELRSQPAGRRADRGAK